MGRARPSQPPHHGRVNGRDSIPEGGYAVDDRRAGDVYVLLDGEGHPGQGAEGLAAGAAPVGLLCSLPGAVCEHVGDGVY